MQQKNNNFWLRNGWESPSRSALASILLPTCFYLDDYSCTCCSNIIITVQLVSNSPRITRYSVMPSNGVVILASSSLPQFDHDDDLTFHSSNQHFPFAKVIEALLFVYTALRSTNRSPTLFACPQSDKIRPRFSPSDLDVVAA